MSEGDVVNENNPLLRGHETGSGVKGPLPKGDGPYQKRVVGDDVRRDRRLVDARGEVLPTPGARASRSPKVPKNKPWDFGDVRGVSRLVWTK